MFCNKCGAIITSEDLFCKVCGQKQDFSDLKDQNMPSSEKSSDIVTDASTNQSSHNTDSLNQKTVSTESALFQNTIEKFDTNITNTQTPIPANHSKKRKRIMISIFTIILVVAGIMSGFYITRYRAKPLSADEFEKIMTREGFHVIDANNEEEFMDGQYEINEYLIAAGPNNVLVQFFECGSEELATKFFDSLCLPSVSNKAEEEKTTTRTFANWEISTTVVTLGGNKTCIVNVHMGETMILFTDESTTDPENINGVVNSLGFRI